ncbi:MAG: T9SS type A sorting domain-containing protein [Chitinophagales bacterium]
MNQFYSAAVILLLLIFHCYSYAEIIFSDTLGTADCYEEGYSLIPFGNGYLCNSVEFCPNGSNQRVGSWVFLDENGDSLSLEYNNYSGYGKELKNGDILIYGGESAGLVYDSVFIHRFNDQGQWFWTFKSYLPDCSNAVYDVAEDSEENIYVCGTYGTVNCNQPTYQSYIFKLNSSGELQWSKTYTAPGGELQFYDIKISNNKIYVAGFKDSSSLNRSAYYAQFNLSGQFEWFRGISTPGKDLNGYSIARRKEQLYILAYDDSLRLFITDIAGQSFENINLGARCGSRYFHIENSLDDYLLVLANKRINFNCSSTFSKIDSSGRLLWEKNFGGLLRTFHEADSGSFLLAGEADYLPQIKVLRFDTTYTSRPPLHNNVFEQNNDFNIGLYPNPSTGIFYLDIQENFQLQKIRLIDLQGRIIAAWNQAQTSAYQIPKFAANGIYQIQLRGEKGILLHKKLILLR